MSNLCVDLVLRLCFCCLYVDFVRVVCVKRSIHASYTHCPLAGHIIDMGLVRAEELRPVQSQQQPLQNAGLCVVELGAGKVSEMSMLAFRLAAVLWREPILVPISIFTDSRH